MDTINLYHDNDSLEFQRNAKRIFFNLLKISTLFWLFWFGFYLYLFGWKIVKVRELQTIFFAGACLPIFTSSMVFIQIRLYEWNWVFKKIENNYCLYRKGIKTSKKICSMINERMSGKYYRGYDVTVIDEDGKKFILFKGLSKTEAAEVLSIISSTMGIPVELIDFKK